MATKPTLFVALEGPVLTSHGHISSTLGQPVAPYAKEFLGWAKNHFNVCLLTDSALRDALRVANHLGLSEDSFSVKGYLDSKVEAVGTHNDFYWLDSNLIPDEINWLAQHGKADRFMPVVPTHGVTPEHRKHLESTLKRR
jgi:hypothetical protein